MKVWHLINYHRGGVARFLEELLRALPENQPGCEDQVAVYGPAELDLPDETSHIRYENIGETTWGLNVWNFAVRSFFLARKVRADGVLFHSHSLTFGKPDIHTVHGLYCRDWRSMYGDAINLRVHNWIQFHVLSALERRMLKASRYVVFASIENRSYVENHLSIHRPDSFRIINHGVDTTRFSPELRARLIQNRQKWFPSLNPEVKWLLFVGNNYLLKGLLRILASFSRISDSNSAQAFAFLILGVDEINRPVAEEMAVNIGGGSVQFIADDSLIPQAFGLSDAFLMDSHSEAGPLVLLEAMASGCVPIVTDFGFVSEFVESRVNGFVARDSDEIIEFALKTPRETLERMSQQAARAVETQTWKRVARKYMEIYQEANLRDELMNGL